MYHRTSLLTLATILKIMFTPSQAQNTALVLIYSATVDFRHDSIPTAIEAMKSQGPTYNVQFNNTEDPSLFTDEQLAQYDALVFLMNTGEVLDADGQAAFQRYIDKGGNFIGIHAASDCLRNSTFMEKELGAHFDYHPAITNAIVDVIGPSHPSTSMLPAQWQVYDEMYNFKSDPRSVGAIVILSANESSYTDPGPRLYNQGSPHPTAWFQEHGAGTEPGGTAGRSFYTSLGHTNDTWKDSLFLGHVMGGISWALQSGTTRFTNSSALVGSGGSANSTTSTSASFTLASGSSSLTGSTSAPTKTQSSTASTLSVFGAPTLTMAMLMLCLLVL